MKLLKKMMMIMLDMEKKFTSLGYLDFRNVHGYFILCTLQVTENRLIYACMYTMYNMFH